MFDKLKSFSIPPRIQQLISDIPAGVRNGPPEVYAEKSMDPAEIFRHLRAACRKACALPPVDPERYVSGSEAYLLFRVCHGEFHAHSQNPKVREFQRNRCLAELIDYNEGRAQLPDYVKSAIHREVTSPNVPTWLCETYRAVVEIEGALAARVGDYADTFRPAFRAF